MLRGVFCRPDTLVDQSCLGCGCDFGRLKNEVSVLDDVNAVGGRGGQRIGRMFNMGEANQHFYVHLAELTRSVSLSFSC